MPWTQATTVDQLLFPQDQIPSNTSLHVCNSQLGNLHLRNIFSKSKAYCLQSCFYRICSLTCLYMHNMDSEYCNPAYSLISLTSLVFSLFPTDSFPTVLSFYLFTLKPLSLARTISVTMGLELFVEPTGLLAGLNTMTALSLESISSQQFNRMGGTL